MHRANGKGLQGSPLPCPVTPSHWAKHTFGGPSTQPKHRHSLHQLGLLAAQAVGCRRAFFHQGRVLPRGLVHLADRLGHLAHTGVLFLAGAADFAHDGGDLLAAVVDVFHGLHDLIDLLATLHGDLPETGWLRAKNNNRLNSTVIALQWLSKHQRAPMGARRNHGYKAGGQWLISDGSKN